MMEFDPLIDYPSAKRQVERTITNRIIACSKGKEFYDGDRANGYGGYVDDGRWGPVAQRFVEAYGLKPGSFVLQIGSDKGFLLNEFQKLNIRVAGMEDSTYPIMHGKQNVSSFVRHCKFTDFPYKDKLFSLVIAIGPVYTLNLSDAIRCLKEIGRVGERSFITLGAYDSEDDYWKLRRWSLLGTTILKKYEWCEVMGYCNYQGDYKFVTAESLGL